MMEAISRELIVLMTIMMAMFPTHLLCTRHSPNDFTIFSLNSHSNCMCKIFFFSFPRGDYGDSEKLPPLPKVTELANEEADLA